jgi:glycosyltransferase involved in cell wall biosynthesis
MNQARVLFVAPSAYTLSGLATWLDYVIPGLRACGWDARLGLVAGPTHHDPERYLRVHPVQSVEIISCATATPEGRVRALELALGRVRPELAVSVNIPDLFSAIARRRTNGHAAPRAVMSVHGIESYLYADARKYADMLDAVVCTNRLACALTGRLAGIEAGRVHYASYGVEVSGHAGRPPSQPRLQVLYSGRLEAEQKRVDDLVGIVRALRCRGVAFQLEIAGDGPSRASLEAELASERDAGEVVFHGQLPMNALLARYAAVDAVIITSLWETGPIVAWEAMAQGAVVVSSRYIGSGLEGALADRRNCRLFEIGDVEGAASALAELHADSAGADRLRAGADELLSERFLIPASLGRWDDCLRRVLASGEARGAGSHTGVRAAHGRMDRWLGSSLAESIRQLSARRSRIARNPGGEWPHSHSTARSDDEFWRLAKAVDRGEADLVDEALHGARSGAAA